MEVSISFHVRDMDMNSTWTRDRNSKTEIKIS